MIRRILPIVPWMLLVSCQGQAGSSKTAPPPKTAISSARIQGNTLLISGTYFAPATVVTLGGTTLKLGPGKPHELAAVLPDSLQPGNYLLGVSAGTPTSSDTFTVTIGAAGPPGPSGPPGASANFPPGVSILSESPTPPKGFASTGLFVISQGGDVGWSMKAPMPTARSAAGAAIVKGVLYVIGGTKDPDPQGLTTVEAYDIATNTWTTKAPMPTGRSGAGVGVLNGSIYVVGGSPSKDTFTGAFEVYDPASNKWSTKSPIPTPKRGVAAAIVGNVLYVIGDFASFSTPQAAGALGVEAYDPVADTWTPKAALPTARTGLAAGVANNLLYALGGSADVALGVDEAYDPATNTWIPKASLPGPRKGFVTGTINGVLYVVGGRSDTDLIGIAAAYDPMHDSWTPSLALPIPVESPAGCASEEGVLYVAGGSASAGKPVAALQTFVPSGPRYYIHKSQ